MQCMVIYHLRTNYQAGSLQFHIIQQFLREFWYDHILIFEESFILCVPLSSAIHYLRRQATTSLLCISHYTYLKKCCPLTHEASEKQGHVHIRHACLFAPSGSLLISSIVVPGESSG